MGGRVRLSGKVKIICGIILFVIAFSVRALVAVDLAPVMQTRGQPVHTMSLVFHYEALRIVKGDGVLLRDGMDSSDTSLLIHAPGYAIYIAGIYKLLGMDYFSVQLVQNAMNSIAPLLIFLIAGRVLTWPVGIIAGLITAVWHHFAYYSNVILPDSVCVLPILAAVYLLEATERGRPRSWWVYAAAGAMSGLSVWIRPNTLMLGLLLTLALPLVSIRRRQTLKRSWLIGVTSLLVVAPITLRNYVLYGEFIPVSINTGIVLWEGIADAGGERFGAVRTDPEIAAQEAIIYDDPRYGAMWAWPDGIQRDRDRLRKGLGVIARNPFWFARAMVWRVPTMFKYSADAPLVFKKTDLGFRDLGEEVRLTHERNKNDPPNPPPIAELSRIPLVAYGESISWLRPPARLLQRSAKETSLVFIVIGLLVVLVLSPRRAIFILLVPFYYFLFQAALHTEFRYTLPLHHFMFVFSAVVWVLIGHAVWRAAKRLINVKGRSAIPASAA